MDKASLARLKYNRDTSEDVCKHLTVRRMDMHYIYTDVTSIGHYKQEIEIKAHAI